MGVTSWFDGVDMTPETQEEFEEREKRIEMRLRRKIAEECREGIHKDIENFIKTNCKQINSWQLRYHVEALHDRILDMIRIE